jgi:alkylation response protein AidB-like acyl-CoA dehydrogenase
MRFPPDDEQREFARTLDRMLTAADTPSAVRAWATGDHAPGRALWTRLADAGVLALAVPEAYDGGLGPLPVELALAFVELGRHAVPGPLVETVAAAALLEALGDPGDPGLAKEWLPRIASGQAMVTLGSGPYILDADASDAVLVVDGDRLLLAGDPGPVRTGLDPARRLFRPTGSTVLASGPAVLAAVDRAADRAALATAAQALGVGLALLTRTVEYVKQRRQFGAAIASFQAVKHRLADTLLALEFARPLLHAAALTGTAPDVAAAKAACCDAAHAAARTALQLHGAIGYTAEYDLSLWITKARALRSAWGTPAQCRARVLGGPRTG